MLQLMYVTGDVCYRRCMLKRGLPSELWGKCGLYYFKNIFVVLIQFDMDDQS